MAQLRKLSGLQLANNLYNPLPALHLTVESGASLRLSDARGWCKASERRNRGVSFSEHRGHVRKALAQDRVRSLHRLGPCTMFEPCVLDASLDLAVDYAETAKAALAVFPNNDWRQALEALADFSVSRAA